MSWPDTLVLKNYASENAFAATIDISIDAQLENYTPHDAQQDALPLYYDAPPADNPMEVSQMSDSQPATINQICNNTLHHTILSALYCTYYDPSNDVPPTNVGTPHCHSFQGCLYWTLWASVLKIVWGYSIDDCSGLPLQDF